MVSYQSERFSSKWELPFLPPSSLELWRKERARKAALILMKISHFDRTLQYKAPEVTFSMHIEANTGYHICSESLFFFALPRWHPQFRERCHTPSSREPLGFGERSGIFWDGVAGVRTPNLKNQKRTLYPLHHAPPGWGITQCLMEVKGLLSVYNLNVCLEKRGVMNGKLPMLKCNLAYGRLDERWCMCNFEGTEIL